MHFGAFYLVVFAFVFSAQAAILSRADTAALISKMKKQTANLALVNQRAQAVVLIDNEMKQAEGDYKNKLNDLRFNVLNEFLSLPSQEAFETAAPLILSDRKKALNNIQMCLSLEPENLQCQWLELKYLKKYNEGEFNEKATLFSDKIKDFRQMQLLKFSLYMALGQQSEVPTNLKSKTSNTPEETFLINIINYNLAVITHDFVRVTESLNYFNTQANDYPDLVFMNYQVSQLWPEKNQLSQAELERQNEVYKKKCADLPASTARKYFSDIALCTRGLK